MGNAISGFLDEAQKNNEAKAVENLRMLQQMVDGQLDKFDNELDA